MGEARQAGAAEAVCIDAVVSAHDSAKADDIFRHRDEDGRGREVYLARADAAATLTLQLPQLRLPYQVRAIGLCCLGLLAYIAYRVA